MLLLWPARRLAAMTLPGKLIQSRAAIKAIQRERNRTEMFDLKGHTKLTCRFIFRSNTAKNREYDSKWLLVHGKNTLLAIYLGVI